MINLCTHDSVIHELDMFIQHKLEDYARYRNYDFGSEDNNYVSALSPAITRGIITEEYIVNRALKSHKFKNIQKFIEEICWRTYWRGYLEQHRNIWDNYIKELSGLNHLKDNDNYINAIKGGTGIECFDVWVKDLIGKNYLHNHVRMWFASIWTHTLGLPWQLGADLFMSHLLDADSASNTLSWRWVVGLHTKNKYYLAREDNIKKYTNNNFYPVGLLANQFKPMTPYINHNLSDLNIIKKDYEKKIDCLLIHENDLSFKNLPESKFVLFQKTNCEKIKRSKNVRKFINNCLKNRYLDLKKLSKSQIIEYGFGNEIKIKTFIKKNKITKIHTPYPKIGYLKTQIDSLEKYLSIDFEYIYSNWDCLFWPNADKGFFKLKKQIPRLIEQCN